jgi:hypothetical protein
VLTGAALLLAATGCDDDDDASAVAGSGGGGRSARDMGAAEGGSGGTQGGKGGGGGKSDSPGTSGTGAEAISCVSTTTQLFQDRAGGLSAECISCICKVAPKPIVTCDGDPDCWVLIDCVYRNCRVDDSACAQSKCGMYAGAAGNGDAAGDVLRGDMCSVKCVPEEVADAGAPDAG